MKQHFLPLLFILLLLPIAAFAFLMPQAPEKGEQEKTKANRELLKNLAEVVPKDAQVKFVPELLLGHRVTEGFHLCFCLPKVFISDPEEGMRIFLPYLQKTLEVLNTTPEIRPYMAFFPILPIQFTFALCFGNPGHVTSEQKQYLDMVGCYREKFRIAYHTTKPGIEFLDFPGNSAPSLSSLFEEAAKKSALSRGTKKEIPIIPNLSYTDIIYDGLKNRFQFSLQFAQKEGYFFLSDTNMSFEATTSEERGCFYFVAVYCAQEKRITLEDAKELARRASREHLDFFKKEETAQTQMKRLQGERKVAVDGIPRQENLDLRFDFWDTYIDRIHPPHIAEIHVLGRTAYYYNADEYQRLVLLEKEEFPNVWAETKEG